VAIYQRYVVAGIGVGTGAAMRKAAPPGGVPRAVAKRAYEQMLWERVRVQGWLEGRRAAPRPRPAPRPATDLLSTRAQWQAAVRECRRLGLPRHPGRAKNWDALGALSVVLDSVPATGPVLDAGAARYSPLLPWLWLYGYTRLIGTNLEFTRPTRHGPVRFEYADVTGTDYPDASFDAVTCLSVLEHGVPVEAFLKESARLLRGGGVLVLSTDYDRHPQDTAGAYAYGAPVHIFGPDEIEELVELAAGVGLRLRGPLRLDNAERPVHWRRLGLDFTFLRLTFDRS
jgi:SAM-dependent methyltransferase